MVLMIEFSENEIEFITEEYFENQVYLSIFIKQ